MVLQQHFETVVTLTATYHTRKRYAPTFAGLPACRMQDEERAILHAKILDDHNGIKLKNFTAKMSFFIKIKGGPPSTSFGKPLEPTVHRWRRSWPWPWPLGLENNTKRIEKEAATASSSTSSLAGIAATPMQFSNRERIINLIFEFHRNPFSGLVPL